MIVTLDSQSRADLSTIAMHKAYIVDVTQNGTITLRPVTGTELPTLDEVRQRTVRLKETNE